jgi:hypothetical protein
MNAVNGDLSRFVAMHTAEMDWTPSPSRGVWRKRLHHVGPEESGQVTSIVRFEPGSSFPSHDHPDGEEILVLEGVFSDEQGDFGPGSYLLNPEGFRHAPYSAPGCVLFVKLRQYPGRNRPARQLDSAAMGWVASGPCSRQKTLFREPDFADGTWLEEWGKGCVRHLDARGGLEILLIEGTVACSEGSFGGGDWLRFPAGGAVEIRAEHDARAYVKAGFYDLLTRS